MLVLSTVSPTVPSMQIAIALKHVEALFQRRGQLFAAGTSAQEWFVTAHFDLNLTAGLVAPGRQNRDPAQVRSRVRNRLGGKQLAGVRKALVHIKAKAGCVGQERAGDALTFYGR